MTFETNLRQIARAKVQVNADKTIFKDDIIPPRTPTKLLIVARSDTVGLLKLTKNNNRPSFTLNAGSNLTPNVQSVSTFYIGEGDTAINFTFSVAANVEILVIEAAE